MVDTQPGVASYARVSYARELMGDVPGAIKAMEAARDIAGTPADSAWASYQLGRALLQPGRPRRRASRVRSRRRDAMRTTSRRSPGSRRWRGRAGHLQQGDRRLHRRRLAVPLTRIRDRARRPVHGGRPDRSGRAAVRARPRRGAALPGERREHRPGAGAVRCGARRSRRRARPPLATSGPSDTACTWPTRTPGRSTRTGDTRRRPSTPARPWRSGTATRCSRSTPG